MARRDYKALGLKVGLEIHQQLDTGSKLFCECAAELVEEEPVSFERRLRPTRSELGEVDPAALFEWRRGRYYEYESPGPSSCLVEADEEPPHPINREALAIALAVAMYAGSWIPSEVYVMRKVVIDGSNTSGFQRTAVVALGGSINAWGKEVPIETIALEEDAARKLREADGKVVYRLDRLGIPLIEIATAPVMRSPEEAKAVALAIGRVLRLTGRVKRGIGTIRQDLNVSIEGGAKTEIKGVQRLELISKVVELEVERQLGLIEIREEMRRRGITEEDIRGSRVRDLTKVFEGTKSKLIARAIRRGGVVYGVGLKRMRGLIGRELAPGRRFGTEISEYVKFWSGAGGILHSDELPGYGISGEEVARVKSELGLGEEDAFVIVADEPGKARKAVEVVIERVREALRGVPEETRAANPDGTTRYMRPRPGSARMYPETDLPPVVVDSNLEEKAREILDHMRAEEERLARLLEELTGEAYRLSPDLAKEVIEDDRADLIVELLREYGGRVPPSVVASMFTTTLRYLRREGYSVDSIPDSTLREIVDAMARGLIAKEALEDLVKLLSENPGLTLEEAVDKLGLRRVTLEEAERLVERIIREEIDVVKSKGLRSKGLIMGKAMKFLRGKIEGKTVSDIVDRKLSEVLKELESR